LLEVLAVIPDPCNARDQRYLVLVITQPGLL
jgi:hypothetical protein